MSDDLERRVARLERAIFPQEHATPVPFMPTVILAPNQCEVCGIKFDGGMGYVCPNLLCPRQARAT